MKTAESHNAELTGSIHILPMPPIPEEAWKWIEEAQRLAERASASTKVFPDLRIKKPDIQADSL